MTTIERGIIVALVLGTVIALVPLSFKINAWEKAAGYPYGHLCDLYRTCDAR